MGVKELLNALILLGLDIKITVMGIQIADVSWGMELSEKVQNSVQFLKEEIIKRLNQIQYN